MNKKQNLVSALKRVISAINNDTIHYEWTNQGSCNCGLVAQALVGRSAKALQDELVIGFNMLPDKEDGKKIDKTWKNGVKYFCPLTGEPLVKIFKDLEDAGLTREDIVHLEFMTNPAILERSGIKTTQQYAVTKETKRVSRFFGLVKDVKTETKEILLTDDNSNIATSCDFVINKPYSYYQKKENLVKYLAAWVAILEETRTDVDNSSSREQLESELLRSVAAEDYEKATIIRDKIRVLA